MEEQIVCLHCTIPYDIVENPLNWIPGVGFLCEDCEQLWEDKFKVKGGEHATEETQHLAGFVC